MLEQLKINLSFEDIKDMSVNKFLNLVRNKCKVEALDYLGSKRGSKGAEIQLKRIQMSEYLLPNEYLKIEEQRRLFEMRNRMVDIPSNFLKSENNKSKCMCGKIEDIQHIYECENLNIERIEIGYEKIFTGNTEEQRKILKRFEQSVKKIEKIYKEIIVKKNLTK